MSADEVVAVVDDDDRVVGHATRREVRERNLRHRSVYILVFNSADQLFIHRRTTTKDIYPGYWDVAVGGVLQAAEEYEPAARRELEEELGVAGIPLRPLFRLRYEDAENRVWGAVYRCTFDGPLRLQVTEIERGEWLHLPAVLARTQSERFCPDGLAALRRYALTGKA